MLHVWMEINSPTTLSSVDLGHITIGNMTDGLEDNTGRASYRWEYRPDTFTDSPPSESGEVHGHARSDGWERLVATIVNELAERRAARRAGDQGGS